MGAQKKKKKEILRLPRGRFRLKFERRAELCSLSGWQSELNAFNQEEITAAMVSVDPVWGPQGQFKGKFWNGMLDPAAVSELRRNEDVRRSDSFCYAEEMLSSHSSFPFFYICFPHCWSSDILIMYGIVGVFRSADTEPSEANFIPETLRWAERKEEAGVQMREAVSKNTSM